MACSSGWIRGGCLRADAVEYCLLDRAERVGQRELGVQGHARLRHHSRQASLVRPRGGVDEERILTLINERKEAKAAKNYAVADQIRKQLDEEGIELKDTPEGTVWKLKGPSI